MQVRKRGQRWAPQFDWLWSCSWSTNWEISNNESVINSLTQMQLRALNKENQRKSQRASQAWCSKTAKMSNLFAGVVAADPHSRSVWARERIASTRPFVGASARSTRWLTVASVKLPFGETGATIQIFMRISNSGERKNEEMPQRYLMTKNETERTMCTSWKRQLSFGESYQNGLSGPHGNRVYSLASNQEAILQLQKRPPHGEDGVQGRLQNSGGSCFQLGHKTQVRGQNLRWRGCISRERELKWTSSSLKFSRQILKSKSGAERRSNPQVLNKLRPRWTPWYNLGGALKFERVTRPWGNALCWLRKRASLFLQKPTSVK